MENKTQHEKILDYMKHHGSITTMQAFADLGCTKLTTRISELRKLGYNVQSVKCTNDETGSKYNKYFLVDVDAEMI